MAKKQKTMEPMTVLQSLDSGVQKLNNLLEASVENADSDADTALDNINFCLPLTENTENTNLDLVVIEMLKQIEMMPKFLDKPQKTSDPYNTNIPNPVLDVRIKSPNISENTFKAISNLFSVARAKNMIIRTTVMADSDGWGCAIAVQGTESYRVVFENTSNKPGQNLQNEVSANTNVGFNKSIVTNHALDAKSYVTSIYRTFTKIERVDNYLSPNTSIDARQWCQLKCCDKIRLFPSGKLVSVKRIKTR
ncbi:MAG: hypothetical protein MJ187_03535 [Alphaproteobacteria bacterium]|nr:hypothetical protein [Alphaproteobacteria bacterium]